MTIFPSENEKKITLAIIAFLLGLGVGIISIALSDSKNQLTEVLGTLFAAFIGAWTAFKLENRSRLNEKREMQLDAANKIIFALYERLNAIKILQLKHINPVRNDPARFMSMQPVLDFTVPSSSFDAQDVSFLTQSPHKALMLSIHIANQQFLEAVKTIKQRSNIHLNDFQPALARQGLVQGDDVTGEMARNAMGDRNYHLLMQSTEYLIEHVDTFIENADKLRDELIKAFSDIFSQEEIFRFVLKNDDELESSARHPA